MLGLILLYVGIVLISNGICRLTNVEPKSTAIMNFFTGTLGAVGAFLLMVYGVMNNGGMAYFYGAATTLLFAFTYLFVGFLNAYNLDARPLGWYCLFVAINTIPAAMLSYKSGTSEGYWFTIIWILWGILWLAFFVEIVLNKKLPWIPHLCIFEGIATCWIPAWLLFLGYWI